MDLLSLREFIGKAALATYAGNGKRRETDKKGFIDMEYREGDFYYQDSFAGYLASHGQEIVWYQDIPIWMCSYAGGMRGSKIEDADFANATFEFLKKAMRSGENSGEFQPRGPKSLKDGDWEYKNDCTGDISNFRGHEEIHFKGEFIFEHDYLGGVLKDGRK